MSRWVLAAGSLLFGAVLVTGSVMAPADLTRMEGTCPGPSTDPGSVCYDSNSAQAMLDRAKLAQALQVAAVESGYRCWTVADPRRIPTHVVMRSPTGVIRLETFDQGWRDAHHGSWTLALCS